MTNWFIEYYKKLDSKKLRSEFLWHMHKKRLLELWGTSDEGVINQMIDSEKYYEQMINTPMFQELPLNEQEKIKETKDLSFLTDLYGINLNVFNRNSGETKTLKDIYLDEKQQTPKEWLNNVYMKQLIFILDTKPNFAKQKLQRLNTEYFEAFGEYPNEIELLKIYANKKTKFTEEDLQ